jgi:hypothetical protein
VAPAQQVPLILSEYPLIFVDWHHFQAAGLWQRNHDPVIDTSRHLMLYITEILLCMSLLDTASAETSKKSF